MYSYCIASGQVYQQAIQTDRKAKLVGLDVKEWSKVKDEQSGAIHLPTVCQNCGAQAGDSCYLIPHLWNFEFLLDGSEDDHIGDDNHVLK